jgi:nuclease-like protein
MARIYPAKLDPNTKSPAEKKLFPVFRDALGDDYMVFHGKALQAFRTSGGVDDREIDFLAAHPTYGLLVIEVKGGLIAVNGPSGVWLQNGKTMRKTPVQQARSAANDLFRYLQQEKETSRYSYPTRYELCFPDVDVSGDLSPDAPRELILDKRDVQAAKLPATVEAIYKHYHRTNDVGPGEVGLTALVHKLAPSHVLRSLLSKDFEDEDQQIKALTEEQYDVLDDSERNNRLIITGCTGSGKTMLALEKVRRLLEDGKDVRLTCYNKLLANWLQSLVPANEHFKLVTFHNLCMKFCGRAGRNLDEYHNGLAALGITADDYYNGVLPNALREAIDQTGRNIRV